MKRRKILKKNVNGVREKMKCGNIIVDMVIFFLTPKLENINCVKGVDTKILLLVIKELPKFYLTFQCSENLSNNENQSKGLNRKSS